MARIKIAVYAISKNEIKHAQRWAEATKDADYRIVADTGSTDGTQEVLKELGVDVYQIHINPWRFDDARNAALALVPEDADVCLILDLDEVPQEGFFDKVRKGWKPDSKNGWITMDTGSTWLKDRLHSRDGWHWKYPCHEHQMWYGNSTMKDVYITDAIIKHLPDDSKSRSQYLQLLELSVREYPQDARMWTYMTREYYFNKRWDDVLTSAHKALECHPAWNVEQAAVCRWAAEAETNKGNKEAASKWLLTGVDYAPSEGEAWFYVSMDAYRNNNWQQCLDTALRVLEISRSTHYCYEPSIWDWQAYDLASIAAYNLRHIDEAVTFARHAVEGKGPETERIQRNLDFFEKVKDDITSKSNTP